MFLCNILQCFDERAPGMSSRQFMTGWQVWCIHSSALDNNDKPFPVQVVDSKKCLAQNSVTAWGIWLWGRGGGDCLSPMTLICRGMKVKYLSGLEFNKIDRRILSQFNSSPPSVLWGTLCLDPLLVREIIETTSWSSLYSDHQHQ